MVYKRYTEGMPNALMQTDKKPMGHNGEQTKKIKNTHKTQFLNRFLYNVNIQQLCDQTKINESI